MQECSYLSQHFREFLGKKYCCFSCRKKIPAARVLQECPHCWPGLRPNTRAPPYLCLTSLRLDQDISFWWGNKLFPEVGPEWSFFKKSGWNSGELSENSWGNWCCNSSRKTLCSYLLGFWKPNSCSQDPAEQIRWDMATAQTWGSAQSFVVSFLMIILPYGILPLAPFLSNFTYYQPDSGLSCCQNSAETLLRSD